MSNNNYLTFRLTISTVTPVHIGSGMDLLHEYDYVIYDGYTWRINDAALLDAHETEDLSIAQTLARTKPAQLLNKPEDFNPQSPFFRYRIKGVPVPRSSAEGAVIQEQLKDVYDRPFLPGSTFKGAIRTAIAWVVWEGAGLRPDLSKLKRNSKFAAQEYEHTLFGNNPNHDLMRALHITDSQPLSWEHLMLVNARVLNRQGTLASPIESEAIRPDVTFTSGMKLDSALFTDWARQGGLRLREEKLLTNLAAVVQAHSRKRIEEEINWYKQVPQEKAKRPLDFYLQLNDSQEKLGTNKFFIQIGAGTGWDDKTFGSHLKKDKDFLERIINQYSLSRGTRNRYDPSPASRRVIVSVAKSQQGQVIETAAYPMGWVLVEIEPVQ